MGDVFDVPVNLRPGGAVTGLEEVDEFRLGDVRDGRRALGEGGGCEGVSGEFG